MSLEQFLRSVVQGLAAAGIPAMMTGSVAAAFRGATRATMDVDLVIEPDGVALEQFTAHMEAAGYYVSLNAAREALAMRSMFNVIDPETGWKADLIVRRERDFSKTEFARREQVDFLGVPVAVARIEDLIVAKLEWAKLGASPRQIEDVKTLLRIGDREVDLVYVEQWVRSLGLEREWSVARSVAGE